MSHRDEYIKNITIPYSNEKLAILVDIAWSLHNIAAMLMEQNGYIDPYGYLCGKENIDRGSEDESISE